MPHDAPESSTREDRNGWDYAGANYTAIDTRRAMTCRWCCPRIESFLGRLKVENRSVIHEAQDLAELTEIVDDRLNHYNQDRRYTALGNRTPMAALEEFLTRGD